MATSGALGAIQEWTKDGSGKDGREPSEGEIIEPKEFFWDQFLKYISTGILALTVLNVSVEFLRGGGVTCFPPSVQLVGGETDATEYEFSRGQGEYINNYCSRSVPPTEYFPIYILVHGILLIAPHYIWNAVYKGDFDSFFAIVEKFDRLRDSKTGEYDAKNIDRVMKLEIEYEGRKIFWSYVGKLFMQLLVCFGSILFSGAFFLNFSFTFSCPPDFSPGDDIPENWPLNVSVPCVYSSLRLLSLVRYADYMLLCLAIGLVVYGLVWCFVRHTTELGHKKIAKFIFRSCLSADTFVFPPVLEKRQLCRRPVCCRRWFCCCSLYFISFRNLFNPRIKHDLDFLLMRLFRADSSHGRVFKDIQVHKELRKLTGRDHQLLHLYINAQQDMRIKVEREIAARVDRGEDVNEEMRRPLHESRMEDLRDYFRDANFTENPENSPYFELRQQQHLGNVEWKPMKGIRDRLYGFVSFAPKRDLALDITFGSIGFSLVLARPFRKVVSVNYHPFYRNLEEVCTKEEFYTNYVSFKFPANIFTQSNKSINKVIEEMFDYIGETQTKLDFILVGPIDDETKKVSVNLMIEMLYTAKYIGEGAILLAIRPLKISHQRMRFSKYEPPTKLFDPDYHGAEVHRKLEEEVGFKMVDGVEGIRVPCGKIDCVFEFHTYKFIGVYPDPSVSKRTPRPTNPLGDATDGSTGTHPPDNSTSGPHAEFQAVLELPPTSPSPEASALHQGSLVDFDPQADPQATLELIQQIRSLPRPPPIEVPPPPPQASAISPTHPPHASLQAESPVSATPPTAIAITLDHHPISDRNEQPRLKTAVGYENGPPMNGTLKNGGALAYQSTDSETPIPKAASAVDTNPPMATTTASTPKRVPDNDTPLVQQLHESPRFSRQNYPRGPTSPDPPHSGASVATNGTLHHQRKNRPARSVGSTPASSGNTSRPHFTSQMSLNPTDLLDTYTSRAVTDSNRLSGGSTVGNGTQQPNGVYDRHSTPV